MIVEFTGQTRLAWAFKLKATGILKETTTPICGITPQFRNLETTMVSVAADQVEVAVNHKNHKQLSVALKCQMQ